jgi:hypothetical protein
LIKKLDEKVSCHSGRYDILLYLLIDGIDFNLLDGMALGVEYFFIRTEVVTPMFKPFLVRGRETREGTRGQRNRRHGPKTPLSPDKDIRKEGQRCEEVREEREEGKRCFRSINDSVGVGLPIGHLGAPDGKPQISPTLATFTKVFHFLQLTKKCRVFRTKPVLGSPRSSYLGVIAAAAGASNCETVSTPLDSHVITDAPLQETWCHEYRVHPEGPPYNAKRLCTLETG